MFVILLINLEISSSGKLHTIFVAKFGGYVVLSTSFYLHNQKTALNGANQCAPGVFMVRTTTDCKPLGVHHH